MQLIDHPPARLLQSIMSEETGLGDVIDTLVLFERSREIYVNVVELFKVLVEIVKCLGMTVLGSLTPDVQAEEKNNTMMKI